MNKQLLFVKRPQGQADASTWSLETNPIPEINEGEILVKQHFISLDPAMRGWMNEGKSYIEPMAIGSVMRAGSVGEVVAAKNHPKFKVGDYVSGFGGVQQYAVSDGNGLYSVDPKLAPLPTYIGTLGMPGMTAYFGILEVGKIKEGDTVVVSGAAGAVGSIVGQIAKIKGCTVIGIAGGADKCKYIVEELGFDGAIDYKNEDVNSRLKEECPKGLDVYFDNVGGEILDCALARLRMNARIVICGAISQYNNKTAIKGPSNYLSLLVNRATMQGMVVFDWANRYGEAAMAMGTWLAEGKLKSREAIFNGIENFPQTYNRLFSGDKLGKLVLKVIEDQ
ncbi:NADP-dependent oxidoreductase [Maribacter sp. HTCC2170]|uniref:NADP-dependent oxidoreductase n=1 Tax=Maribacter sp. (strain HTCC2170 / KCCM 42371) TaxID=313603 RepID=UPI00006B489E|nr:NADP-dependent oxidoreductase [Maribacter sp. HTCC2170]EAR01784.1 putative NADP-dependent oxidoreductase [Maribacter sp. HTCC2170]